MKKIKLKEMKQTVEEYNNWFMGIAIIYLNRKTGEVWTNVYFEKDCWTDYDDVNIIPLHCKRNIQDEPKMTMKRLKDIIKESLSFD